MAKRPTYEELERRIKELEKGELDRMRVEKELKPNVEQIDLSDIELENPHLVDGKYSIKDLIDIESLHKTLEKFSSATGFTTGFVEYPSQKILIATGWRDICTKFHRAFPESATHCKNSNIYLTKQLKELQDLNIKPCKNGLVDGATPIVIKGKNIASLVTGQILFEEPDIERFKKQAEMYGYDLERYLEALSEVPVVSEDQFKNALSFLSELAVIIGEIGLNNLELKERSRELEEEITQHKLTGKTLQESEEHFRKLAEGSFEAIVFHDKGVILEANNQYYEMFGYNPDELTGKDAISLTATSESAENIKKQISLGNLSPYEVTGVKKDGTKFPMQIRAKLTSYKGHEVRIAVIRNLTEQKQSERELRKSEQKYRLLVESTLDWVWICDEEGLHTFSNNAVKQILGYEVQEILGVPAFNLMHPEDRKRIQKWFQNAKSQKRGWKGSVIRWQHKDKSIRFLETIAEPIFDAKGILTGFTGIDRDVTARKQSEEALQKAHDKLKKRTIELEIKRKGLEELNTAMRVLLKKREMDKTKMEEYVLANVKKLIEPYFGKIKKTRLSDQQKGLLRILESNLNEIISPFTQEISLKHFNLTPTEIQIAKQIRHGHTTKKIAAFMNVSPRTVETHRKNIRRKIGLEGKKANLRTYLLSIN
jgi:PAS domain S-box-containing protein